MSIQICVQGQTVRWYPDVLEVVNTPTMSFSNCEVWERTPPVRVVLLNARKLVDDAPRFELSAHGSYVSYKLRTDYLPPLHMLSVYVLCHYCTTHRGVGATPAANLGA